MVAGVRLSGNPGQGPCRFLSPLRGQRLAEAWRQGRITVGDLDPGVSGWSPFTWDTSSVDCGSLASRTGPPEEKPWERRWLSWWSVASVFSSPARVAVPRAVVTGGFGTWAWAASQPQRFAAAIPICGGGNPKNAAKLVGLPIWAFHGGKDRVVPLSRSRVMVDAIQKAGGKKVKLTVYPNAGHDSWTKTYDNPGIYKWLLEHRRPRKPEPATKPAQE